MEYRKLTPAEAQQAAFISSQAFDYTISHEDLASYLEEGAQKHIHMRGAVDENGKVLAGLVLNPYEVWFDGHVVGMGGIGGVSSRPECRRGGHIRGLFGAIMEEMRERGMVFSFLSPFSHVFYRKFGYELGSVLVQVEAPTAQLARYVQPGYGVQYQEGMDIAPFLEVDRAFAPRHNMMTQRPMERWEKILKHDPMETRIRTYILYSAEDKPIAWFQFTVENKVMKVMEMEWVNREGLWAMLGFWGRFAGNYDKVSFLSSPELVADVLWTEPYEITTILTRQGMTRVVDVQKALEWMRKPEQPGEVVLKVQDDFCRWNDRAYRIAWADGESCVTEAKGSADGTVSVQALSQMVTGLYPLKTIVCRPDVQLDAKESLLEALFPQKQVYCQEHF